MTTRLPLSTTWTMIPITMINNSSIPRRIARVIVTIISLASLTVSFISHRKDSLNIRAIPKTITPDKSLRMNRVARKTPIMILDIVEIDPFLWLKTIRFTSSVLGFIWCCLMINSFPDFSIFPRKSRLYIFSLAYVVTTRRWRSLKFSTTP